MCLQEDLDEFTKFMFTLHQIIKKLHKLKEQSLSIMRFLIKLEREEKFLLKSLFAQQKFFQILKILREY